MAECQLPRQSSERIQRPVRPLPPVTDSVITNFSAFQKEHDKGYKYINKGLALDEHGQVDEAISRYREGLSYIDRAMTVNAEELSCSEEEKDSVKEMQQKMTKTKLQIEYRLQSLQAHTMNGSTSPLSPDVVSMDTSDGLPSYEQAVSTSGSVIGDVTYSELGDDIMSEDSLRTDSLIPNAMEIFCIPDGVQIFYITPEGYVSAPSYPSSLRMFEFLDSDMTQSELVTHAPQRPPAFLQVDEWYYPLIPGASPALRATNGSYIFPDTTQERQGSSVGLLLPPNTSPAERRRFEQMLSSMTDLREQQATPVATPTAPPPERTAGAAETSSSEATNENRDHGQKRVKEKTSEEETEEDTSTSSKISKGIMIAADWMSWGLGKGAEKAGHYIKLGSEKIKSKINPEENPKEIDPRVQKGVKYARQGAHVCVEVSSFLVKKLGEATMAVAKEVAPVIRKQGEKILPKSITTQSKDGKSKVDGVVEVAATGLKGFGTVYVSLEKAAKALGRNIANETVQIVDHKYGGNAGQLAENAIYTVGNVAMTAYTADNFGIKAIAKRTAKDTGKAVLQDLHNSKKNPQNQ